MAWAKEIYVATTQMGVYYTSNFVNPNIPPIWERIENGLPTIYIKEFHLDPFQQANRQYILTDELTTPEENALLMRFMGEDWVPILTAEQLGIMCLGSDYRTATIKGFCTDTTIEGRLWVTGIVHGHDHYYGPFGWGPYAEVRIAYTDNYGETWYPKPSWWTGWYVIETSSIRSYGNTVYVRSRSGVFDIPRIWYSYDGGNTIRAKDTDFIAFTTGGFLNPLTPNRFYYDTREDNFHYFENGILYQTIEGIKLGWSRWDTIWYNESNSEHMRLVFNHHIYTTYDGWQSATTTPTILTNVDCPVSNVVSLSPYAGDNPDYMIIGVDYGAWDPSTPNIVVLESEDDTTLTTIAGANWNNPPYVDSIPRNSKIARCGVQAVRKTTGNIYVNAVAMMDYLGNMGAGVPMEGDRSVWNARYYSSRHANDINSGSSAIHHTLSQHFVRKTTGSYKFAPGDHSHYFTDMDAGSSVAGELLTSLGTGSPTWKPIPDHSHAGSAIGDGNRFNADHLKSGSAQINSALTYDAGNIVWRPVNNWKLSLTEDEYLNDSDKEFVVPTETMWQILWVWVEYNTSATAGTRQLELQLRDVDNTVIGQWQAGITQNDSLSYKYLFGLVIPDLTSLRDGNYLMTPIPTNTFLSAGQKIRIWDNNAIDPTDDDMIVRMQYTYRPII